MVEVTDDGQRLPQHLARRLDAVDRLCPALRSAGPPARVGLLMINLGAGEALMQRAIDELPGEVSLAFLAGTPDLPRWLRAARERGHESYLMLPVEDPTGPAERGLRPIQASRRAGREPAPAARRDGARRGLCRLRGRLGRPGLAVRSRSLRPL